eukprot:Nk52_evm7s48 gene=Nk52_evmTU7s48
MEEFVNTTTVEATMYPLADLNLNDRSNSELGIINAYEAYHNHQVAFIVGAFFSSVTARLAMVAKRYNAFIITPASNSPALSSRASYPTLVRGTFSSIQVAQNYAQICVFYGWKKIAVMHTDDLFATGSADAFIAAAKERGIEIVYVLTVPFGITAVGFDLTPGITAVKAATNIYFASASGSDSTALMAAGKTAGIWGVEGVQWIGDGFSSPSLLTLPGFNDGSYVDGFRGMLDVRPGWDETSSVFQAFQAKFHAKKGTTEASSPIDMNPIYSYDATTFALKVLEATVAEVISLGLSPSCLLLGYWTANKAACQYSTAKRLEYYQLTDNDNIKASLTSGGDSTKTTADEAFWNPDNSRNPNNIYLKHAHLITITGASGSMSIETTGDRIAPIDILNTHTVRNADGTLSAKAVKVGSVVAGQLNIDANSIVFMGGTNENPVKEAPKERPPPTAPTDTTPIIAGVAGGVCLILICVGIFIRLMVLRARLERELKNLSWVIDIDDIQIGGGFDKSKGSMNSAASLGSEGSRGSAASTRQVYIQVGQLNGEMVAMKKLWKDDIILTKTLLREVVFVKEMVHTNVNPFIGACIEDPDIYILMDYCSKGSLEDVLSNEKMQLDLFFKYALMQDICKGMIYIHNSPIGSHGHLKSSNCLLHSTWTLRITDYGLCEFKEGSEDPDDKEIDEETLLQRKYWTAPELLKEPQGYYGTQKGDVFAYGIIGSEIVTRERPYYDTQFEPNDVLKKVVKRNFRPDMPESTPEALADYIELVWDQDPDDRPDFPHCLKMLKKINPSKGTVMDQMAKVMEKEIKDLELRVTESGAAIIEEEERFNNIYYHMVPESLRDTLRQGTIVAPEEYKSATMMYTNVVGFPKLVEESKPKEVVDFLHNLYMYFDVTLSKFNVFQVETIGDTYSVVTGIPDRSPEHASEAADVALHLLASMRTFKIRHRPQDMCQLRIGLHTGSCIAGIVGLKRPRYYLFGELVHLAMRMEATGLPLRIHCSQPMFECLLGMGGFKLKYRGEIMATKQTKMKTYWLVNAKNFNKKMPDWTRAETT